MKFAKYSQLIFIYINIFYVKTGIPKLYDIILLKSKNVRYDKLPLIRGKIKIVNFGKIQLGSRCIFNSSNKSNPVGHAESCTFYVIENASLLIGNNVGISNTLLYCTNAINIEDDVMIGGGCQVLDTDFHSLNYNDRISKGDINAQTKPVHIKKGAFIGCNSIILKGVVIGEKSVIGAGSVVRSSIPDNEIWGGNPAIFIKKLNSN